MIITNCIAKIVVRIAQWLIPNRGIQAATYYPFIFMWPPENAKVDWRVFHEKVHYEQWKRYWIIGYVFVSLYYYMKYGYWNHPFEIEARERTAEFIKYKPNV